MIKIAWITPSLKTGLGKYTDIAVNNLRKHFQIEVFVGEEGFNIECLKDFETVVYNIGNSRENLPVYLAMRNYPGIVILHDRTYHHFFAFYYLEYLRKIELYLEVLSFLYGDEVAYYAESEIYSGRLIWETEDCLKYPMVELILPHALAVVVHSYGYLDILRKKYDGPSIFLPFPFMKNSIFDESQASKESLHIPDDKIVLFSYGFMSKNRMLEESLRIIGENPEIKDRVYYVIAGSIHEAYLEKINEIIDKYKLQKNVRVCGFIPDRLLYDYLSIADVCINMRRYSTEGASWSLLEQMFAEKVVIASDRGFFSELPDEVMLKIRDVEDFRNKLLYTVSNINEVKNYGRKAKKYVMEKFNPDIFCEGFTNFIKKSRMQRARLKVQWKIMREFSKVSILSESRELQDILISELSKFIYEIFSERP